MKMSRSTAALACLGVAAALGLKACSAPVTHSEPFMVVGNDASGKQVAVKGEVSFTGIGAYETFAAQYGSILKQTAQKYSQGVPAFSVAVDGEDSLNVIGDAVVDGLGKKLNQYSVNDRNLKYEVSVSAVVDMAATCQHNLNEYLLPKYDMPANSKACATDSNFDGLATVEFEDAERKAEYGIDVRDVYKVNMTLVGEPYKDPTHTNAQDAKIMQIEQSRAMSQGSPYGAVQAPYPVPNGVLIQPGQPLPQQ